MGHFASDTQVPVDRSRLEIERTLVRYGADQFLYGWDASVAVVRFRMSGRMVCFRLPMPRRDDRAFTKTETGRDRTQAQAEKAYEQACRQRWRALALVVKAKLEAVASEITTFDEEFLAHIMLPDGSTVGEQTIQALSIAYETGQTPLLLPGLIGGGE